MLALLRNVGTLLFSFTPRLTFWHSCSEPHTVKRVTVNSTYCIEEEGQKSIFSVPLLWDRDYFGNYDFVSSMQYSEPQLNLGTPFRPICHSYFLDLLKFLVKGGMILPGDPKL